MTDSPEWLDELIEATLAFAAEVSGIPLAVWSSGVLDGLAECVPALPNAPWLLAAHHGPTYRSEPIPGAELGGRPRNPEADVVDEIDRLVDWQLKDRGGW